MSLEKLAARPTLYSWVQEYNAIEGEYLENLAAYGIGLAPVNHYAAEIAAAKKRLRAKGALFRNGDASIVTGPLSSACVACTEVSGSRTFFLSLTCNRDCYFCFNPNQADYDQDLALKDTWRQEIDEFAATCECVTHIGLTGGEPLLHKQETLDFFEYAQFKSPGVHTRLYTAGDFFDAPYLEALAASGLQELRMSIKLDVDDGVAVIDDAIAKLELAQRFIPDVMVEMPVIPGTGTQMRRLLKEIDRIGCFGINLLEFGYPMGDWAEFAKRGFSVKNPPFPVVYSYGYAGGLPIDGSELLCLELIEFAIYEGLKTGIHYCSLENKNRSEVRERNSAHALDPVLYELDEFDFFYKVAKVFDGDVARVAEALETIGAQSVLYDPDEEILAFHPHHLAAIADLGVLPALSINVLQPAGAGWKIRELKLLVLDEGVPMLDTTTWQARATAWELAAFSFAYPTSDLAEALASGEWAEATAEIAEALDLSLAEDTIRAAVAYAGRDTQDVLHSLRVEATRLFVGSPEPVVTPYEGVWRAADDGVQALLFVNPHTMAVERAMKAVRVGRPEGAANEPLDRVDAECSFLQYLCMVETGMAEASQGVEVPEGGWAAEYDRFLDEHARTWMPRFAERVFAESREPFYRVAAGLLGALAR